MTSRWSLTVRGCTIAGMRSLDETETRLLEVWRQWPLDSQRDRRQNAYASLGLSEVRATQIVNRLLTDPAALEHDPVTVGRLRRLRDSRLHRRAS